MDIRTVAISLALAFTACVADPEEPTLSEASSAVKCAPWMCGSNSPVIDNFDFHELNWNGVPNGDGLVLQSVELGGGNYRLKVYGGEIVLTLFNGGGVKAGIAVEGAILHVAHVPDGTQYDVKIVSVDRTTMWGAVGGVHKNIYTYQFNWQVHGLYIASPMKNVCTHPSSASEPGMPAYNTVVFEGDRINASTISDDSVQDGWFNIGCAGTALAKLQLTGYTEGTKVLGYNSERLERTAMLKMFAADYCGTGDPWTVSGTPLVWRDQHDWNTYVAAFATVEAHWGPHGAVCLETPRLDANRTADGVAEFGSAPVLPRILALCPKPDCHYSSTLDTVSANPN